VIFEGVDLVQVNGETLRKTRRKMQMIFQDPYASLNPRMTVGEIMRAHANPQDPSGFKEQQERVEYLLKMVGLNPAFSNRYRTSFPAGSGSASALPGALALDLN
jgi:oligopeptide transport system ATP-binding protein